MFFHRWYMYTGDLREKNVCNIEKCVLQRTAITDCVLRKVMNVFTKCLICVAIFIPMYLANDAYSTQKMNVQYTEEENSDVAQDVENCFSAETDIPAFSPTVYSTEMYTVPVNMPEVYINGGLKRYLEQPLDRWCGSDVDLQSRYREEFWKNVAVRFDTDEGRRLGYILGRVVDDDNNVPMSVVAELPMPRDIKNQLSAGWNILLVSRSIDINIAGFPAWRHQPKKIVMDPLNLLSEALMNQAYGNKNRIFRWSIRHFFGSGSSITTNDVLVFPTRCYRFHVTE